MFLLHRSSAQNTMVELYGSGKLGYTKGKSFQKFVDSYNRLNIDNQTKLLNFGFTSGYAFGCNLFFNKGNSGSSASIYMGYYQHRVSSTASSQTNNFITREFRLKQNTYGADFGFGKSNKVNGMYGFFSIDVANVNIIADIRYRDGYRSNGNERLLNGVYNAFGFSSSVGIRAFHFFGPVGIHGSMRWTPIFGPDTFDDYMTDKRLPEDWESYFNSGGSGNYNGKYVTVNFQSFYFDLGISINILQIH